MRIALTMRVTNAADYHEPRDSISHDWMRTLEGWGMTPLPTPNAVADAAAYLSALSPDLLILTGGDDSGDIPERDKAEGLMLSHAIDVGLPVLGVCRGMQMINQHYGGKTVSVEGHAGNSHAVAIEPTWQNFYGAETMVNSYHRLGISGDELGQGLTPTVFDGNNLVEGFQQREKKLAAIMWHPEREHAPAGDRRLIEMLIAGETGS